MYKFNRPWQRMLAHLVAASGLLACDEAALAPASSRRPLAVVDGRPVTMADLERRIAELPENQRPRTREAAEHLLAELVDVEVLAAEARRRGFDGTPEARGAVASALAEVALAGALAHEPGPDAISADEVERYYRENLAGYTTAELRRLSVAGFATREAASAARRAGEVRGTDLGEVSKPDAAVEEGARRGTGVPEPFVKAGFALASVGDVSEPIEHEGKFWVVVFTGRTEGEVRPLAREEGNIRRLLAARRLAAARDRLVVRLRERYPVEVRDDVLRDVAVVGDLEAYDPAQWKRRR